MARYPHDLEISMPSLPVLLKAFREIPLKSQNSVFRLAMAAAIRPVARGLKAAYRQHLASSEWSTGVLLQGGESDILEQANSSSPITSVARKHKTIKGRFYALAGARVTGNLRGITPAGNDALRRPARYFHLLEYGFQHVASGRFIHGTSFLQRVGTSARSEIIQKYNEVLVKGLEREVKKAVQGIK